MITTTTTTKLNKLFLLVLPQYTKFTHTQTRLDRIHAQSLLLSPPSSFHFESSSTSWLSSIPRIYVIVSNNKDVNSLSFNNNNKKRETTLILIFEGGSWRGSKTNNAGGPTAGSHRDRPTDRSIDNYFLLHHISYVY